MDSVYLGDFRNVIFVIESFDNMYDLLFFLSLAQEVHTFKV